MTQNYDDLIAKAKQIETQRASLETQKAMLEKQEKELQESLVSTYGENYMDQFNAACAAITEWENAQA
jgi:uncharacterized protein (DUF3084 family)